MVVQEREHGLATGRDVSRRLPMESKLQSHTRLRRKRRALPITDTELKLIASAAILGDSGHPVNGQITHAANSKPSAL